MTENICKFFADCGGCDFLDLPETIYREIKKQKLLEVFAKYNFAELGKSEFSWLFDAEKKLGLRRKISLHVDTGGRIGFFQKASNELVAIDSCPVSEFSELIGALSNSLSSILANFSKITLVSFDSGVTAIFETRAELKLSALEKLIDFGKIHKINLYQKTPKNIQLLLQNHRNQIFYRNFKINLEPDVFIQATKAGFDLIIKIITDFLAAHQAIKKVADLYAGFGSYSFAVADFSPTIKTKAFEGSEEMTQLIQKNAASNQLKITANQRDLFKDPLNANELNEFDLAIINPPRNGAATQVIQIAQSKVKNVILICCNNRSFVRDARILVDAGFKIEALHAIDQFYSTPEFELVGIFRRI